MSEGVCLKKREIVRGSARESVRVFFSLKYNKIERV